MSHKKDPLEITGIEQIQLVEPDDYASRHARLHREAARSDRAVSLELCGVRAAKKRPARVPRNTEPCNLVSFLGIVSGGAAAAFAALVLAGWAVSAAVFGWTVGAVVEMVLQWVGVR